MLITIYRLVNKNSLKNFTCQITFKECHIFSCFFSFCLTVLLLMLCSQSELTLFNRTPGLLAVVRLPIRQFALFQNSCLSGFLLHSRYILIWIVLLITSLVADYSIHGFDDAWSLAGTLPRLRTMSFPVCQAHFFFASSCSLSLQHVDINNTQHLVLWFLHLDSDHSAILGIHKSMYCGIALS